MKKYPSLNTTASLLRGTSTFPVYSVLDFAHLTYARQLRFERVVRHNKILHLGGACVRCRRRLR